MWILNSILWASLGGWFTLPAFALEVLPMELEFDPAKTTNFEMTLRNGVGEDRAVVISVVSRRQDGNGQEGREASQDFFVFPRQAKVLSGQSQTVKLVWQGSKELKSEQAYRLIVEQLPVEFPAKNSLTENNQAAASPNKIEFLYKFVASIYARPSTAAPKLEWQVESFDKKSQKLKLKLNNTGTAHQLLEHGNLIFDEGQPHTKKIPISELPTLFHFNVLGGSQINVELPWNSSLPPKSVVFEEKEK